MSTVLNYGLRDAPTELWDKDRWTVLTFLMLHSNVRNRCWPSMKRIAKRLGKSPGYVGSAKKWLIEHKAVSLVPYKMRLDDEQKLPRRQHVYQLTGEILFDGQTYPYMYIASDNGDTDSASLPQVPEMSPHEISPHGSFAKRHLTISNKNPTTSKDQLVTSNSLNREFAKSLANVPPLPVKPTPKSRPVPPLLELPKPTPKPSKKPAKAAPKVKAELRTAPKVRAPRKPLPTDPLWNAIADAFFNGARRDNQQLARILFGQQNHGLFGLIANEAERQNLQPDSLDYGHLARLVPQFAASLPLDKVTGKHIELRDPATWLTRWEGWRNSYTDCVGANLLPYDPNCPFGCDKGAIYNKDGSVSICSCQQHIMDERKKAKGR